MACEECPLNGRPRIEYPMLEKYQQDGILVIGAYPTPDRLRNVVIDTEAEDYDPDISGFKFERAAFMDKKTHFVRDMFDAVRLEMQIHRQEISVTYVYACQCYPTFNNELKKYNITSDIIYQCAVELRTYIDRNRFSVIMAMGNEALKALGIKGTATNHRGSIIPFKKNDESEVPVVCTYHPITIAKENGLTPVFKNDIRKTYTIAKSGFSTEKADITVCNSFEETKTALEGLLGVLDARLEGGRGLVTAFDTETTSTRPYDPDSRVISMSFSWGRNQGLAFPWQHKECPYTEEQYKELYDLMNRIVSHPKIQITMANGTFDYQWMAGKYKFNFKNPFWDTQIAEHCLSEDKVGEYSLKDITRDRLPEYGNYEGELDAIRDKVWAEKDEKIAAIRKEFKENRTTAMLDWWVGLTEEKRREILYRWMEQGLVTNFNDIENLAVIAKRKVKGVMTIPAKYKTAIKRTFSAIPEEKMVAAGYTGGTEPEIPEELQVKSYEDIPLDKLLWYGAMDAAVTRLITELQLIAMQTENREVQAAVRRYKHPELDKRISVNPDDIDQIVTLPADIKSAYTNISMPLSIHLAGMMYKGVLFDRDRARQYGAKLDENIAHYNECMLKEVGHTFNPESSADLVKVLYEEMGYPVTQRTEKGTPSVDAESLKTIHETHPDDTFVNYLMDYRKAMKINNTYIKGWLTQSDLDGRIHCQFKQTGTKTYRLSSSNPNLQNVPFSLKLSDGTFLNLKALFLPDKGYDIYDADVSNAEMRVLTAYSRDETLTDAFNNGKDLHCLTATGFSGLDYDYIKDNKEDKTTDAYNVRQVAKRVNFGSIYSMSGKTLQTRLWEDMRLKVSEEEAQGYLDGFFATYPGVKRYMERSVYQANVLHYTYTFFGRLRRFPFMTYDRSSATAMARQGINARIQTTSSDLVMQNLIDLDTILHKELNGQVLLTVHDSIVFQAPEGAYNGIKKYLDWVFLERTAERAPWLPVQWKYDAGWGPNYGEAHGEVN